jgi:hypothetical protein
MTPREQIIRTVAAMTDDECLAVFPQLRRWWLDVAIKPAQVPRQHAQSRQRRATDQITHREIVRYVVDSENRVKVARTYDAERTPEAMRWPVVIGVDIAAAMPETVQRERLTAMLDAARQTCLPQSWQFPSAIIAGETRITHVYATGRTGHMAVSIWMVPAVPVAAAPNGTTGACIVGFTVVAQQLASWLF